MQEIVLTFNQQDLQLLNDLLVEVPYKISAPLIFKINQQIEEQCKNLQED